MRLMELLKCDCNIFSVFEMERLNICLNIDINSYIILCICRNILTMLLLAHHTYHDAAETLLESLWVAQKNFLVPLCRQVTFSRTMRRYAKGFFKRIVDDFKYKQLLSLKMVFFVHASSMYLTHIHNYYWNINKL